MAEEQILEVEKVYKAYGDLEVLRGIDFSLCKGEVVCIIGPSGSGKSTLLRCVAGFEPVRAGTIALSDTVVSTPAMLVPPERRSIGMVFQDFALFPHLTNLANVMFGLRAVPKAEAETTARLALSRVGLASHALDYPHTLSGGEQQRVALARAIAPRPGILLMDEPFSGLDALTRLRLQTMAVELLAGRTVLLITHDPLEALRLGEHILVMNGRPATLQALPDLPGAPPRDPGDPAVQAAYRVILRRLEAVA